MKPTVQHISCRQIACILLLLTAAALQAQDGNVLDRKIMISKTRGTVYELLKEISEQTDYFFIYDSQLINNDRLVTIQEGEYTVKNAIYAVTLNNNLQISVVGNYILLNLPEVINASTTVREEEELPKTNAVQGKIYDLFSKEVIPYSTVYIDKTSIGTITNKDGEFRLIIPDSLVHSSIKITHVGYETVELSIADLYDEVKNIFLEPKVIPLQEVVVRAVNPISVLQKMLAQKEVNYPSNPVYITSFYRELVEYKSRNVNLTESVLKIYKADYRRTNTADQVKLIKMRRILDYRKSDSVVTKVKSGIDATLMLDLMKRPPEFLKLNESVHIYDYAHSDIRVIDGRYVNVISFEQKKNIPLPLERGELCIDTENYALVEARFELNPSHIEKATPVFVEKKSRNFKMTLRRAAYVVSYKPDSTGIYYLNNVRGELEFRIRKRRHLFSSPLKISFEMVNCNVEENNVRKFISRERISPRTIFSETKYQYDPDFWGHFNIILPEDKLKELILTNLSEVSQPSYDGSAD